MATAPAAVKQWKSKTTSITRRLSEPQDDVICRKLLCCSAVSVMSMDLYDYVHVVIISEDKLHSVHSASDHHHSLLVL